MTTTEDIAVLHRIAASLSADLADGGVTAAAIEAEVVSPERARSLVQERDEAKAWATRWQEAAEENEAEIDRLRAALAGALATVQTARSDLTTTLAEHPRPLAADDITDEMVKRGAERFRGLPTAMSAHARVRTIIRAALTPPPSRPEGAEGVDEVLRTFPGTLAGIRDISDHLASHGVRAGGDS